jgi:hypothetical protein
LHDHAKETSKCMTWYKSGYVRVCPTYLNLLRIRNKSFFLSPIYRVTKSPAYVCFPYICQNQHLSGTHINFRMSALIWQQYFCCALKDMQDIRNTNVRRLLNHPVQWFQILNSFVAAVYTLSCYKVCFTLPLSPTGHPFSFTAFSSPLLQAQKSWV